jgi:alkylhydroperoxidase family enzyme
MENNTRQGLSALRDTVMSSPGDLAPAVRQQIATLAAHPDTTGDDELPQLLAAFVQKVARRSYTVTDADIAALRAAGYSEDAIFEAIVSAAVGAGIERLTAGLAALDAEG